VTDIRSVVISFEKCRPHTDTDTHPTECSTWTTKVIDNAVPWVRFLQWSSHWNWLHDNVEHDMT